MDQTANMLNEFILKQLEGVVKDRDALTRELEKVTSQEEAENKKLQDLLDRDDVGVEVFSPRASGKPVNLQAEDIHQKMEDLEYQEALVRDQLEQTLLKEEKLRKMLIQARNVPDEAENGPEQKDSQDNESKDLGFRTQTHDELEVILKRIDHCYEICISDPEACRNELRTLQYYVKALLTKAETI